MIWIEIVCDACNDILCGESYRKGSVQRIKEDAKRCGWKTIKGELYCPCCQRRLKTESEDK